MLLLSLRNVKRKSKTVVEYSLTDYQESIGMADWQEQITKELLEDLQSRLPSVEETE